MKRLQEIAVDRTLAVSVKCQVNQSVIDKNFEVIIDCLKDLSNTSNRFEQDLKNTNERTDKCEKDIQKILRELATLTGKLDSLKDVKLQTKTAAKSGKQRNQSNSNEFDADLLDELRRKLEEQSERNKKNNIQNLKDINLLLSDVKEIKKKLDGLDIRTDTSIGEGLSANRIGSESGIGSANDLQHTRVVQNQMQRQLELINKLFAELDALKIADEKLDNRVTKLETGLSSIPVQGSGSAGESSRAGATDLERLLSRLEKCEKNLEKLDMIEKKLRLLPQAQDIDNSIGELRAWVGQLEETINKLREELNDLKNKKTIDESELLKTQNSQKQETISSRKDRQSELQHENQHKWLRETLKNAVERIQQLQKQLRENKERMDTTMRDATEDQGKEKLPNINKRSLKLKRQSYQNNRDSSKDRSSFGKDASGSHNKTVDWDKKLNDLKVELQQWLKQMLDSRTGGNAKKDEDYFKDLELKLQELRLALDRKADQEGMRKYLTFLENKINQLFMVLAQPQSEDALIARKGWGCLSCAKKLEKYKGRLGEHLNWNNMTTTNYSPPRIGFTQTQVNHKSGQHKGKFGSGERNHSFGYDEQNHHEV